VVLAQAGVKPRIHKIFFVPDPKPLAPHGPHYPAPMRPNSPDEWLILPPASWPR